MTLCVSCCREEAAAAPEDYVELEAPVAPAPAMGDRLEDDWVQVAEGQAPIQAPVRASVPSQPRIYLSAGTGTSIAGINLGAHTGISIGPDDVVRVATEVYDATGRALTEVGRVASEAVVSVQQAATDEDSACSIM